LRRRDDARAAWIADVNWKPPEQRDAVSFAAAPPAGSVPAGYGREIGGHCTVDGRPGTLQPSGRDGWLVCRPNSAADSAPRGTNRPAAGQPMRSFSDAEQARNDAYAEYVADLVQRRAP
jgi:hypothetical protein